MGAEVIATDAHGRPALLLRRVGDGDIILCTYPIEDMAAVTPRVNPDATVTLYDALADHAGVRRPVTVEDPRVTCDMLVRDDGADSPCSPATPRSHLISSPYWASRGHSPS